MVKIFNFSNMFLQGLTTFAKRKGNYAEKLASFRIDRVSVKLISEIFLPQIYFLSLQTIVDFYIFIYVFLLLLLFIV